VRQEVAALGARVEVTGYLPMSEVRSLMNRASVVCVPSIWEEPTGRAAIEAMAEGALVATTGRGGLSEIVGDAALIINSEDPKVWAQQLDPWLRSPELIGKAATKSRRRAEMFAADLVVSKIDAQRELLIGSP
jgi:glycosyltransferase involved in cell wall biosynthesis